MSRLRTHLEQKTREGKKALGLFITAGFPEPGATLPLMEALEAGGADFIELGMPFSDPLAEGLPIQRASEVALRHGITLRDVLDYARAFRRRSDLPLVLMGYVNPVFRYGYRAFCRDAARAGVDGLILADLPPEEAGPLEAAARDAGLAMNYLIAPNTPEARIQAIDARTTGFVYAVSVTGLTGSEIAVEAVSAFLKRARRQVHRNPLLVGFGIKTHEDVRRLSRHTDGCIVGTALIRHVENLWQNPELALEERCTSVQRFVHGLKYGEMANALAS